MHVLCVTPYYKPSWFYGGPPKCIAEINEHLVSGQGVKIDVITLNLNGAEPLYPGPGPVTREVNGVTVHYLPVSTRRWSRAYFDSPLLNSWLAKFKTADLVHVNTLFNAFSRKGMQFAYRKEIPYVVTPHGMLDAFSLSRSAFIKKIHRAVYDDRLLRQAAAVHFTTANEQRNSILGVPVHPVVIPLGFEFPDAPQVNRQASGKGTRLVFLGRINPKKGIDLLIRGLAGLPESQRGSIMLDVYGMDDENTIPALSSLIERCGLGKTISFKGGMDPASRDATLAGYDALVLTSHQENFGLVVTEALSVGLPVYISDKVNLCDFVLEHQCGWVSGLDTKEITRTLLEIHCTEDRKRSQMGRNGMQAVREHFNIDAVARQYMDLYSRLRRSAGDPG